MRKLNFWILATLLLSPAAYSADRIQCEEFDPDDFENFENISTAEIELNEKGKAISIHLKRRAVDGRPALDWSFTTKNSIILHRVEKNKVDFIDEETKQPSYYFNIEDVEVVEALSRDGRGLKFIFNDHRYSGTPGSSLIIGKEKTDYSLGCSGKLRFPMKGPTEE